MNIDKVGWIHLEQRRLLAVRSRGRERFYLPGGKREPGESDADCLCREIREELGVTLRAATIRHIGDFVGPADAQPAHVVVRVACHAADVDGTLRAQAEIAEIAWLTSADRARCSAVLCDVIDALSARGEID